ncbi:MAG: NAD(+) synthase [Lentisphaeria bacterium]|nr:NAD(+) synthase [Lentisphaeria bacterium]
MFGFYRIAAVTPRVVVADVNANLQEHLKAYRTAVENGASLVVFPELSLTGATCGDLFLQDVLLDAAWKAAQELAAATGNVPVLFGLPVAHANVIFNAVAVAANGKLVKLLADCSNREIFSHDASMAPAEVSGVAFGCHGTFEGGLRFAVEIGGERNGFFALTDGLEHGADVVLNPSAEPFVPGRDYGAEVAALSERFGGVYVTVGAGVGESTTDAVYGGHSRIGDRGRCVAMAQPFKRGTDILYYDVDTGAVRFRHRSDRRFYDAACADKTPDAIVPLPESPDLRYAYNPASPFLPDDEEARALFCLDVLNIQAAGLAKRMEHIGAKCLVLGISGGLDSTLALVAAVRCRELLGMPREAVRAYTLPGFGTTSQTHGNAEKLCRVLDVELREINITAACRQHFADLGHDGKADAAFENAQARERTQILMDAANMYGGILIGTGDLSEIALGWCTYNGDQMAMYSVNGSVPKTLIPVLLEHYAQWREDPAFTKVVRDIIGTPISPELLPLGEGGALAQKTEDLVGPYELHDFFIYHLLNDGAEPEKIAYLAEAAFAGRYSREVIRKWLRNFGTRFVTQQFKRSAMPDGAAAGVFSLSPRGGFAMPSDAAATLWKNI